MFGTTLQKLAAAPTAMGLASRLALSRIKQENIDPLPLLQRTKLTQAALDERKRISIASQINFLDEVSRALNDEWLGLTLAKQFDLREIGMLYYVAASSNSFGDALRRIARYARMVSEALELQIDQGETLYIGISYSGFSRHTDRHQAEFFAVALLRICRKLIGHRIVPVTATFIHHRSGDAAQIRSLFGCNVQFDSDADGLSFDAMVLDRPVIDGDPYLNELMVKLCEEAIAPRTSNVSPLRALVENSIAPLLPHGEANVSNVARYIGLSERTFARRLAVEGLSFGEILDDLRRELALNHLREGIQASQIAWLLGFSQSSSFTHACRRWTGKNPSELRHAQEFH
jgi:AraC-like DNA-binding protein